jgi:AraC-like DNA-binding protein
MTDGASFRVEERMGVARLRCDLPPGMNTNEPALVEMMLAGLVRMFEEFGCAIQDIRAVCVEFPRPAHYRTYALAFADRARFSQPFTGIELAAEALDRRHRHHHSELQALMVAEAERSLERRQQPRSYAERVLALLSTSQPAQLPAMREMARRLGVGERSLRRRLEEEGTSYLRLTQRHLYDVACSLLRNANLTLQEIAGALGFGDSAAFHRAFRRWSNATPAEYRHSRRTAATRIATSTERAPHSEPS